MYNFFSPDEAELSAVIYETLETCDKVKSIQVIQTGWTNITMDVEGENQSYIFRFPRNLFFAKMMIKDCVFCQLLRDKVSIPIPDMQLKVNKNRPFSMHRKIKGVSLLSQMDTIKPSDLDAIVSDLALFLSQLHALSLDIMKDDMKENLADFLDNLASVHQGDYDFTYHDPLRQMESSLLNLRIVHGDFHPGNVLIQDGRVSGIIDFAFASISDKHSDLGRFWGRSNPVLGQALVEAYQYQTKTVCDLTKVHAVADVFKYVEYKYVHYMQAFHPEIKIPLSVLEASVREGERLKQKENMTIIQ